MKNNSLIKGVLLLIVIALLSVGLIGCAPAYGYGTYPTTGTVYITIDTWDAYSIYMDGYYQGYTTTGYYTIYDVPVGYHNFEAYGYWYYGYYNNKYISSGANYLTIYTY